MTRKQLNIGLAPEDFARVQEVARKRGVTVTALCRGAILDTLDTKRSASQGSPGAKQSGAAWLVAMLLGLLSRRQPPIPVRPGSQGVRRYHPRQAQRSSGRSKTWRAGV